MLQIAPRARTHRRRHPLLRLLAEFGAGLHTAHGLAHGVTPNPASPARPRGADRPLPATPDPARP